MQLGFAKAHRKSHPEKNEFGFAQEEHPKIWGSSLIFLQWLKLAISNLASSWCSL